MVNGLGEIMKLALVRSMELFCLLEEHGAKLVQERFQVRTEQNAERGRTLPFCWSINNTQTAYTTHTTHRYESH